MRIFGGVSILLIGTLLASCQSEEQSNRASRKSHERVASKAADPGGAGNMLRGRIEGNPAEYPGVVIYRPDFSSRFQFNPETHDVIDASTGNKYSSEGPHADSFGLFRLVNSRDEEIVRGRYYVHAADMSDGNRALIVDIISTYISPPGTKSSIPIDYDANILADFIRARNERGKHNISRNFIVVDSRHLRASKFNK